MAAANSNTQEATQGTKKAGAEKGAGTPVTFAVKRNARKKARRAGDKKRNLKLQSDKEFAKAFFEARSKRSADKKQAFRKKKSRKK